MLDAIDRSCPKGKRDYAMLLLAARYGLRASDIVGITYANFEWEFNRLSLVQAKTGKPVSFPLSEEIGSAIIDYIKFGRPDIDSPHVFGTYGSISKDFPPGIEQDCLRVDVGCQDRYINT